LRKLPRHTVEPCIPATRPETRWPCSITLRFRQTSHGIAHCTERLRQLGVHRYKPILDQCFHWTTPIFEVPNLAVDMDSWARSACYPRGTFYPLSDGASTSHRRITSPDFRPCSTCLSHSQAPLCTCTRHPIANRAEGTFGRLRYLFGGNRPS
jgi:hypothetical protein